MDREKLRPLDDDEIVDKTSIFYKARTVITGTFASYPLRDELAGVLKNLGADINTAISSKTNVVVVGAGAGPKKLEKIEEINSKREDAQKIKVLNERELIQTLIVHNVIKTF